MNELQKFENQNRKKLHALLDDYNPGHDDTQITHFIVGKSGITNYGQYKQALAEINSNYEALKISYYEKRKAEAEIKIHKIKAEKLFSVAQADSVEYAEAELEQVLIEEKVMTIETLDKRIKRNMNELTKMFQLAVHFEKQIEGKDRRELEREFWIEKLSRDIVLNTQYHGGNLSGVAGTIASLPKDMQLEIMDPARRNAHLLENDKQVLLKKKN